MLILRCSGEEILRNKQLLGFDWCSDINEKEDKEYHKLLLHAYFLRCPKMPNFNKESVFRIKLICPIHQKRIKNFRFYDVCLCLYGMDNETIVY